MQVVYSLRVQQVVVDIKFVLVPMLMRMGNGDDSWIEHIRSGGHSSLYHYKYRNTYLAVVPMG